MEKKRKNEKLRTRRRIKVDWLLIAVAADVIERH